MSNGIIVGSDRGNWTSASNAQADSLCRGRHLAQKNLPDTQTDYAETGHKIHAALKDSSNPTLMNSLSLEERETFDSCREIEKKLITLFFGTGPMENTDEGRMRVFREERYWARFRDSTGAEFAHSGAADVVIRAGTKALILDYKTLFSEAPESPRNMQLRDLACLVRGHFVVLEEIAVAIVAPHITHSPEVCLYTQAELTQATKEMFDRVVASNNHQSPRTAGSVQCAFCRAKGHCVEYQKFAGSLAPPAMLTVLEVPMVNWSPEQRAIAASALEPAQKFLDDLKTFLKDGLASDSEFVPGWGLKPGAKREEINNPQGVFDRFVQLGGTVDSFMRTVKVGKTKLKEEVSTTTGARGRSLDKAMESILADYVDFKQNEPSLKRLEGK